MRDRNRWLAVVTFGLAMAWMEAATVVYLRMLVGRVNPYQLNPLPRHDLLGHTELVRELATLVMLAVVGALAGRNRRARLAYALIAFGAWDIFYYVFLAVIVGWPKSIFDWDVLFLLPLPWWGPVLAPMLIAAFMILGGTLVTQFGVSECQLWPARWTLVLNALGIVLALLVFMSDSLRALAGGEEAVRRALPLAFNWPLFLLALALMLPTILSVLWQIRGGSRRSASALDVKAAVTSRP